MSEVKDLVREVLKESKEYSTPKTDWFKSAGFALAVLGAGWGAGTYLFQTRSAANVERQAIIKEMVQTMNERFRREFNGHLHNVHRLEEKRVDRIEAEISTR